MDDVALTTDPLPAWLSTLVAQLEAKPRPAAELAAALPVPDTPDAGEIDAALASQPRAHRLEEGWVDLLAAADGVVLTHLLTDQERAEGVLCADGDLDLWARLAEDGLPLATGGQVRVRSFPETATGAQAELVGPDGWLDAYQPDTLLGLRLRGRALELAAVDLEDKEEDDPEAGALDALVHGAQTTAWAVFEDFLQRRETEDDADPTMPTAGVVAEVAARPGALRTPTIPLSAVFELAGLELHGADLCLPGVSPVPEDSADLTDAELTTTVHLHAFVRSCQRGELDLPDADLAAFLDKVIAVGAVGELADLVEQYGLPEPLLARLRRLTGLPQRVAERAEATVERRCAVVELLAARVAEHDDQPERAEQLAAEALRHDQELAPALCDAGEYAATRGDVVAADGHFQRAGLGRDHRYRADQAKLLTLPPSTVGRNQPCPCGSGRKHKLCCLRKQLHPLPRRVTLLYGKVVWWALRSPRRDLVAHLDELATGHWQGDLLAYDLALFDLGLAERYLEVRGGLLPADERELLESWCAVRLLPYEVADVQVGKSVTLRPLGGGEPVTLADRAFSTCVRRLDLLVARILHDGQRPCLVALPHLVPRTRRHELLALFDDYSPNELAAFFGPQPPPVLRNQDGHELLFCEATYRVADAPAAWERLAQRLEPGDEEGEQLDLVVQAGGQAVLRGTVRCAGGHLVVEANSRERMRELQEIVREAAPDAQLLDESAEPPDVSGGGLTG